MTAHPSGYLRQKVRAANVPSPARTAEERLVNRVIDPIVRRDADRGRVILDAVAGRKVAP